MSIHHLLTDFAGAPEASNPSEESNEARFSAYEDGYNAGWADAIKAQAEDSRHISAALAEQLQDFGFQQKEIQMQVLRDLRPLIDGVLTTIVPDIARATLAPMIVDAISAVAAQSQSEVISLFIAPKNRIAIEQLIEPSQWPKLQITEDPECQPDRAVIKCGASETRVDLGALQSEITEILNAYFDDVALGTPNAKQG